MDDVLRLLPVGVKHKLRFIPERHREDAIMEAAAAFYAGEDPLKAMRRYVDNELFRESVEVPFSQISPIHSEIVGERPSSRASAAPRQSNSKPANAA